MWCFAWCWLLVVALRGVEAQGDDITPLWAHLPKRPEDEKGKLLVDTANCVINVASTPTWLAQAGLQIRDASQESCVNLTTSEENRISCAADITAVISTLAGAGSFIAAAVATCPELEQVRPACAAEALSVVDNTGAIVEGGLALSQSCKMAELQTQTPRRLSGGDMPYDEQDAAWCVVDILVGAGEGSGVGLGIEDSIYACNEDHQTCAIDVMGVVGSFADVGSQIAAAASNCKKGINAPAICAADILQVIAGLSNLAASATAMNEVCTKGYLENDLVLGTVASRRLEERREELISNTRLREAATAASREALDLFVPNRTMLVAVEGDGERSSGSQKKPPRSFQGKLPRRFRSAAWQRPTSPPWWYARWLLPALNFVFDVIDAAFENLR
eukprot:TRINITY_DN4172_c0_g1_i1.p1 TRINITY_DN4172_c0_g1~~TRINITY_DN4172_c0_g1_i1.p1  ORF type:complete len:390 (-),score=51.56 TRINITY_DN4172_c0_g1_i1:87-1256(-)